jgi:hypothetical protein
MAQIIELDAPDDGTRKILTRSLQSAYVSFLIGSGASQPAIPTAGGIEQEIADLFEAGKEEEALLRMYEFLASIQEPMNKLINKVDEALNNTAVENYRRYLGLVETILSERSTEILPKQATLFTTNYDLFIEKASVSIVGLRLNDGFTRLPSLDSRMEYSSRTFFNATYNTGNLYDYKVEIPSINLIKLHGSMSWMKEGDDILFSVKERELLPAIRTSDDVKAFIESYAVVLPQTTKFRTTLMERNYYELLRIYANELDRENALLVTFGFSFGDAHIFDITRKALKNPTLKLVAFAFNEADRDSFAVKFEGYNNVQIIAPPAGEQIDFQRFNATLAGCLPKAGGTR